MEYKIINIKEMPQLKQKAAWWFHDKWNISKEEYLKSIEISLQEKMSVPQWYLVLDKDEIIGGCGVIENDFHSRKDLAPNLCALYVEESCRCRGIAGRLLNHVCRDMAQKNIKTLYLITYHTSFYERYGWEFFCMVQCDEEDNPARMYIHNF